MRRSMRLAVGLLAVATCTLVTVQLRARTRPPALPARTPSDWTAGAAPCAWVFVRPGCGHCTAHLRALDHALCGLDTTRRRRVLGRVHVVGSNGSTPCGVRTEPDSLRGAWGVRGTPLTVLVDAHGRTLEVWHGARGPRAWERALEVLADGRETR